MSLTVNCESSFRPEHSMIYLMLTYMYNESSFGGFLGVSVVSPR